MASRSPPSPATRTFTPPRSIARVLQVVKTLAQRSRPMSLAELSIEFDVPRTSLFAILKGLQKEGYVTFERDFYSLGPESIKLGHAITQRQAFPASVLPVMKKLGRLTSETVILGSLAEDRKSVVYTSVLEAQSPLRFIVNIGTRRPLSASAIGQAILSYLPLDERTSYLAQGSFERFTSGTVTSATELRKVIRKVRQQHCSMTIDGTVLAAVGIAAPYFGMDGQIKGAINVAGPTARMIERLDELKAAVIESAKKVSRILGYTGVYPPALS